jgi:hypothetical protein
MTKNWTPEPNNLAEVVGRSEASFEMNGHRFTIKGYVGGQCMNTMQANDESRKKTVARIVACVNALAGVDDPQAFVERAKINEAALIASDGTEITSDELAELQHLRQSNRELVEALEKAEQLLGFAEDNTGGDVCERIGKARAIMTAALKRAKGE